MNFVWKNMLQRQRQLFVLAQSMAIICFTFQLMKTNKKTLEKKWAIAFIWKTCLEYRWIVHCSKLFMMSVTLLFCFNSAIHHRFFHSHYFHLVLEMYLFFAFKMFHPCETVNANTISIWVSQYRNIFSPSLNSTVLSSWYMLIIAFGLQNDRHSIQLNFCLRC